MKMDIEDIGPCRKTLTLKVPAEDIQAEHDTLVTTWVKTASVPGFRKGRAPRALIETRFAKELISEIRDSLIPKVYHEAVRENKLDPIEIVDFQEPSIILGQPTTFSVTIEVAPAFDLPEYRAYTLSIPLPAVTEEQVTEMLASVRRQHATFEDVQGRTAQTDDLVQVDFTGTLEGKPIDEVDPAAKGLGKASGFWVSLNEHAFLPGFAEGLKGTSIGDQRTIESTFDPSFTVKGIAGKTALFQVTVKAIRHPILPELTPEFLKNFGLDSADALHRQIRMELETARDHRREEAIRSEILKRLLTESKIEALPETQVSRETQNTIYDLVRRTTQRGIAQEKIVEQKEQIFENAAKDARESVAIRFILARITEAEKIDLPKSSLAAYIRAEAQRTRVTEDVLLRQLKKQGALDGIREGLRRQAALEWLREHVTITE